MRSSSSWDAPKYLNLFSLKKKTFLLPKHLRSLMITTNRITYGVHKSSIHIIRALSQSNNLLNQMPTLPLVWGFLVTRCCPGWCATGSVICMKIFSMEYYPHLLLSKIILIQGMFLERCCSEVQSHQMFGYLREEVDEGRYPFHPALTKC